MKVPVVLDHPYTIASADNVRRRRSFSAAVAAAIRPAPSLGIRVACSPSGQTYTA